MSWRVFSQKGLQTGISSSPQHEGLSILGSQQTDPEELKKDFGCCCGPPECCLIGSGKTWLVERTGSTCWGSRGQGDNNWLVYRCTSATASEFTIVGAGIIGYGDLKPEILKLTYNGIPIGDEYDEENEEFSCPTTTYVRVNRQDCISMEVVGTRTANGKAALGFGTIEGNPLVGNTCGLTGDIKFYYPPGNDGPDDPNRGKLGGQGNWSVTIKGVDPNGDYILQISVSCQSNNPIRFPSDFANPVGKFFYIVGDNQAGTKMNLGDNIVEVFQCGEQGEQMIEGRIYVNNGLVTIESQPDCIVRYVYGYITDYIPEQHEHLVNWPE